MAAFRESSLKKKIVFKNGAISYVLEYIFDKIWF